MIDVKELQGEHVVAVLSAEKLNKNSFSTEKIIGGHYMIIGDASLSGSHYSLEDLVMGLNKYKSAV